jgi:UbiD family decarboxylase
MELRMTALESKQAVGPARRELDPAKPPFFMLQCLMANPLDLRAWLEEIRKLGELREVRGADSHLELGAISELNVKKDAPPALLFDEIAGYPKGFRVLTCSTSSPLRLSSILRLPLQRTHKGLVETLRGKPAQWKERAAQYDPVFVSENSLLTNIQKDKDIDVLKFPSPLWHEMDGGRYIGTGCSVVTRDLDSDWVNVGTYRVQVIDRNHVALDMVPGKHGRIHYEKHKAAGKRFPVVIVCGADPLGYLISGIEVPFGMCEWNYIGAILQDRVQVLKGEKTGLPFPAAAEIVLEGFVEPNDERTEGPFGEFHGYYPGKAGTAPVVTLERVYFRDSPIIVGSPPAKPPNDYSYSKAVMRSALLTDALAAAGVPDVQAVWAHEIGGARMFNVVSIKQRYAGHARQAGHILSQCGVGAYLSRYSIVVDDDIDPYNLQEVMWAVATRTDPVTSIDIIQRGMGSKNDPMFVAYPYDAPFSSKAIIDACRPWEHLHEFPAVAEASKELQEKTRSKWKEIL